MIPKQKLLKNPQEIKKGISGITLISLVVTIILLIILAGVSINLLIGDNGIITTATNAREQMTIAEGKEKIELAIAEMRIEREVSGESCTLDYISENIGLKTRGIEVKGIKGKPAVKLYLSYKNYMYKIESNLKVADIGNINVAEAPMIEIIRDTTQTGVEQVNLTVKAIVEEGDISEIVKPDGSVQYASEVSYLVTENGEYTFKAITEKGIKEEKTVKIESIKLADAVEIVTSTGNSGETEGEEIITCSHIYEIKYDDTNHWKQCVLCNNRIENIEHTISIIGEEECKSNTQQTKYCTEGCGYKINLQKPQHSGTIIEQATGDRLHRYKCSVCGDLIGTESCTNDKGEKLGCVTGITGECVVCKAKYDNTKHGVMRGKKCHTCGKKFYDCTIKREIVDETTSKYTWHYVATEPGFEIINNPTHMAFGVTPAPELIESNSVVNDDGSIDVIKIFKAKNSTIAKASIASVLNYKYDGYTGNVIDYADLLPPDNYAPTVKNITVTGADSQTEFSRSAKITALFEETWDSIVEMALFDNDGTVISNWSTASKEGTTFTKEFNVITETTTSKELTVKAKDRCGNIGEGKVTIGKIDTKAPELASKTSYNDTWRISLPIRIEATDEGAGNVQIGLGSEIDYQLGTKEGNKYYRDYNFVGDVYEDLVRIVYLKDEVGNVVTKRITIGKLDRTSPTITNISNNNKTITIEANDINTKLNKEGSGIKGYAISKSREVPSDNNFQASNTFTVEEIGIYYIWVKDNAGNFSETKQIQVN